MFVLNNVFLVREAHQILQLYGPIREEVTNFSFIRQVVIGGRVKQSSHDWSIDYKLQVLLFNTHFNFLNDVILFIM